MKLIRDRLPEILRANGQRHAYRIATPVEHRHFLNAKLIEQAAEVIAATIPSHPAHACALAVELADLLEVVYALAAAHGISRQDLEQTRQGKHQTRGGFTRGVIWHDPDAAERP